jgi:cold shock CspA family protein
VVDASTGFPTEQATITGMSSTGTVRVWHDDEAWGVIDSADTPGGCWAGFARVWADSRPTPGPGEHVVTTKFTRLFEGETVDFEWERTSVPGSQDGYSFRATTVRPHGRQPPHSFVAPDESP